MKNILVVYYSYTSHTKMIAESIKEKLNCDVLELKVKEPYPSDYECVVEIARKEAEEEYTPELEKIEVNLAKYDVIVIGTPVWWYTFATAIRTFLKESDLSKKTIIPYATNAGWLGHTFKDIEKLCPNSKVMNELSIVFTEDYKENKIVTSEKEIDNWIDTIAELGGKIVMNKEETKHGGVFGLGKPNDAFKEYFIGNSYLNPLTKIGESNVFLANVTFEPGCRNNWHIHKSTNGGGQILICVDGEGWYQEEGKEAVNLKPGMVITIPANVKHWHGAKKDSWFSHIAVEVPGENTSNEWCEPVSEEYYNRL